MANAVTVYEPETYYLKRNTYAPNNELPVLVYRDCLPKPHSEATTTKFLESHAWVKKGTWGHIPIRHFHPNTHECYGIFQGDSNLLIGLGKEDAIGGQEIPLRKGDVIVLPAGTAHSSVRSSDDYRYIGVYPKGAPHWRNEYGKKESAPAESFRNEIKAVAKPAQDPVNGVDGPLLRLWSEPRARL